VREVPDVREHLTEAAFSSSGVPGELALEDDRR
jgi:hypothetical protein